MKRLICGTLILVTLCGCRAGGRVTGEAVEGLAKGAAKTTAEAGGQAMGEAIVNSFNQPETSKQEALYQIASRINRSTPIYVDQETVLNNVGVQENALVYNYSLVSYSSTQVDPNVLEQNLYPAVKSQACSHPDMKALWQNNISLYYSYFGNDKRFITSFAVSPSDCQ